MAQSRRKLAAKVGLSVVGWVLLAGVLIFRPKWFGIVFGIGFFGWVSLAIIFLFVSFIFFKTREAKREGGWVFAIVNAVGLVIFIVLCFLIAFHVDKTHLP